MAIQMGPIQIELSENTFTNGGTRVEVIANRHQRGATVSFHNIQYSVKMRHKGCCKKNIITKDILQDLNGVMKPGLNAILGPTGSGKSSFLDVLAARKDPSGLFGEVLINGASQPPNFQCLSGYVVQDDVMMGTLTVRENLCFSAALRLSSDISQNEKEERVDRLITELDLDQVANSRVGTELARGISGGERKRTSIGMELIIEPSVLFLDEPTTGLDASTAYSVVNLLKRMASHGRTIIMSIHQPRYSIYRLFDSLTLLVSGKQVYHGPAEDALEYFSSMGYVCEMHNNPADFFLDVINGHSQRTSTPDLHSTALAVEEPEQTRQSIEDELVEGYRNSSYAQETKTELEHIIERRVLSARPNLGNSYKNGFLHQFKWVLRRTVLNLVLSHQTFMAHMIETVIMAFATGAFFFHLSDDQRGLQNRFGALFFIATNQCFNTLSAVELFITDRRLFKHESISGYYRVSVYILTKIVSDMITLRTIPSIIFSCVCYFMIGFKKTAAAFFIFLLTVTLVAYAATALIMAVSAGQSVVGIATLILSIAFVFMMIFSGLLVNLKTVLFWLAWLKYLSIPRYGQAALEINEFVGLNFCKNFTAGLIANDTLGITCTGEQYLESQGVDYSTWGLWQNHLALIIMTIIFLFIAYVRLRLISKFS